MKTMKFFLYLSFLFIGALSFTACSDDDDNKEAEYESEWKENPDGSITYKVSASAYGVSASAVWTFEFDEDNICTKATCAVTYPSDEAAREALADEEFPENATRNGNTITYEEPFYAEREMTKDEIKEYMKLMEGALSNPRP